MGVKQGNGQEVTGALEPRCEPRSSFLQAKLRQRRWEGRGPGSPPSPAALLARRLGCQTAGLALLPGEQELILEPL